MPSNDHHHGIDSLLTAHGKSLRPGEEIRFTLVKGPNYPSASDPVNPKAPREKFPLIAKFGESVVKPNLQRPPWNTARLYQQDVPKAQDDSDDEAASSSDKAGVLTTKKRWRPRRKEQPKRQWILQEQVEFLETMMAKRQQQQRKGGTGTGMGNTNPPGSDPSISSRYEGIPEHNPSQYCIVEVPEGKPEEDDDDDKDDDHQDGKGRPTLQITLLPTPNGTISFSQPKARKTLSMSEAELAIEDQRGKMTRFMMHDKHQFLHSAATSKTSESRQRLFGKLQHVSKRDAGDKEEDDDDIMGDLAFRNRKGGGRARKELLETLGDSTLKVDADGILGGNNDSEFGKGQRFGRFNAEQQQKGQEQTTNGGGGGDDDGAGAEPSTRGNDGLAMADDFYQRDVQAEYEELDYDANEQFDDDDVDLGESEMVVDGEGFAEDDDDDDLDEDDLNGEKPSGAEGLASVAGFRLLLAKARGEITPEQAAEAAEGAKLKEKQKEEFERRADESKKRKRDEEGDHLAQIMAAAEKSREEAERKKRDAEKAAQQEQQLEEPTTSKQGRLTTADNATGVQVDEHGQRVITLKSVQKEIWLRHGTIPVKRLMKIFDIKKKTSAERQNKFREVVKELCTMEMDPVEGRMFVLKQHYSNPMV